MSYPISLTLQTKQAASLKQTQRLIMSPQMQQAIYILQMPVIELTTLIENELEQNPVLEVIENEEEEDQEEDKDQKPEQELSFDENDFEILKKLEEDFRDTYFENSFQNSSRTQDEEKLKAFQESSICAEISLFEHLMQQAKETFSSPDDWKMAEAIIGNFDENGFLKTPIKEIALLSNFPAKKLEKTLKEIQSFEPYGVGATSLQESLLIQLRCHHKEKTIAYTLIDKHYDDLIHNRIPIIQKTLQCSSEEIATALKKDISRLDLHPGLGHFKHFVQYIIPDACVEIENDQLKVQVTDDFLPPIRINRNYLQMLDDETTTDESKEFIRHKLAAAKWLLQNVHQRNETLFKILELLIKLQKDFFINPNGNLQPLTMKTVAAQLNLHESTIARAVANKYVGTPRGLLPLRTFFTQGLNTHKGEDISSNAVKKILKEFIEKEDKLKPLSDADLSKMFKTKGIECARRTIAKYRAELSLGNAQQRRRY